MNIVDVGRGSPLVLVPGIQGRWEWMKPAVDALARRCRVITFSLADEPSSGAAYDAAHGFDSYVEQIRLAMDAAGVDTAAICGVSFGGLIAAAFTARHPDRVTSLVLVSAIPWTWAPDARVQFYLRSPRLLSPLFMLGSVRLYGEIATAVPGVLSSTRAALRHWWTAATHMFSPSRMAARATMLGTLRLRDELAAVSAPVLVITGEPHLERVVPVWRTHEYLALWPGAQSATLASTGHLGLITRPDAFADMVVQFIETTRRTDASRRRIG